jgi:hypothetical protein
MSENESNLIGYLKMMGIEAEFQHLPTTDGGTLKSTIFNHMNQQLTLNLSNEDRFAAFKIRVGYLPKANIAPLFRQILVQNNSNVGIWFSVNEHDNSVELVSIFDADIGFESFSRLLSRFNEYIVGQCIPILNTFQLPATPG